MTAQLPVQEFDPARTPKPDTPDEEAPGEPAGMAGVGVAHPDRALKPSAHAAAAMCARFHSWMCAQPATCIGADRVAPQSNKQPMLPLPPPLPPTPPTHPSAAIERAAWEEAGGEAHVRGGVAGTALEWEGIAPDKAPTQASQGEGWNAGRSCGHLHDWHGTMC